MRTTSTIFTQETTGVTVTDKSIELYNTFDWYPDVTLMLTAEQQIQLANAIIQHHQAKLEDKAVSVA